VTGLPGGLTANFDLSGHLIDITGNPPVAGTYNLTYTLSDGALTDTGSVTLVVVSVNSSANTVDLNAVIPTGYDFSYIDAGSGGDTVTGETTLVAGTAGKDNFVGSAGNDTLNGLAGDDILDGVGNNDSLDGGAGNDSLMGGQGDDILIGGTGTDTLEGGGNNDEFTWKQTVEFGDIVSDFNSGTDKLSFDVGPGASEIKIGNNDTTVTYDETVPTNTANNEVVVIDVDDVLTPQATIDAHTLITTGALFAIDVGTQVNVYYDPNPSVVGGAVLVAQVTNISDITSATFQPADFKFI
jgi:Ca2+-binding RTX toxin-like protein